MSSLDVLSSDPIPVDATAFEDGLASAKQLGGQGRLDEALQAWTNLRQRFPTDHGTATAAFLMGGAVHGGRVLADWPGLGQGQLFENRDLQPTLDIRAVAKGLLGPHLGIAPTNLARVFPDSEKIGPTAGLLTL
jgi:hypothetical protein